MSRRQDSGLRDQDLRSMRIQGSGPPEMTLVASQVTRQGCHRDKKVKTPKGMF